MNVKKMPRAILPASAGFTLVELLVSLTIFAVLAASGWQVLDQLQKSRERSSIQADKLSALQQAYMQIERDVLQITNRPVTSQSGQDPSVMLSAQYVSFTRVANRDPRFLTSPPFERVTYTAEADKLMRLSKKNIDSDNDQPVSLVLLDDVKNLKFVAYDPAESGLWPPLDNLSNISFTDDTVDGAASESDPMATLKQLPVGLGLSFDYQGQTITWRFALPKPAFKIAAPKEVKEKQSGSEEKEKGKKENEKENDG